MDKVKFPTAELGYRYRGIPDPLDDIQSLQQSVAALKEVVETLIGLRGDDRGSIQDYIRNLDLAGDETPQSVLFNKGIYNQVTDDVNGTGDALTIHTDYSAGDFFTCTENGPFATNLNFLSGQTANAGDRIIAGEAGWVVLTSAGQYLSRTVDDTAQGVITFNKAPFSNLIATEDNHLIRKHQVDEGVQGAKDYADQQDDAHSTADRQYTDDAISAHTGATDPHGDRAYTDQVMSSHVADPDPHEQYALETAALATFTLAAYGGILADAATVLPDLDVGWTLFTAWDANAIATPRYIVQDFANNGIRFEREGIFAINLKISLSHNEAQGGRIVKLRFNNATTGTPGIAEFTYGVGRNTSATNLIVPGALLDIPAVSVGDLVQVELGGGDSFSAVINLGSSWEVFSVSEAKGLEAG